MNNDNYRYNNQDSQDDVQEGQQGLSDAGNDVRNIYQQANKGKGDNPSFNTGKEATTAEKGAETASSTAKTTGASASGGTASSGASAGASTGAAASEGSSAAGAIGGTAAGGWIVLIIIVIIAALMNTIQTPSGINSDDTLQKLDENGEIVFDLSPVKERTKRALSDRYSSSLNSKNATDTIKNNVTQAIKDKYNVNLTNFSAKGSLSSGKLILSKEQEVGSDVYHVKVNVSPEETLDDLVTPIMMYTNAVNSSLYFVLFEQLGLDEQIAALQESGVQMYDYDESKKGYVLNQKWRDVLSKNEYALSNSDAYENAVKDFVTNQTDSIVIEDSLERWNVEFASYKKEAIMVEEEYEETYFDKTLKREVTVLKTRQVEKRDENGNVCYDITFEMNATLPIYFDFSYYKQDVINDAVDKYAQMLIDNQVGEKELSYDKEYDEAYNFIYALIYTQYDTLYASYLNNKEVKKVDDIFEEMIENGIFPDISGLNSANNMYIPTYASGVLPVGAFDYSLYKTEGLLEGQLLANGQKVWTHVRDVNLANNYYPSKGSGIGYQCVDFAQAWLYDHYGIFCALGNGKNCANNLVRRHPEMFKLSTSPVAGAIFSLGPTDGNNAGHVACVEAVDYVNKTITYSEGNLSYIKGNLNIYRTMSFTDFYNRYKNRGVIFAVPYN